MPSESVLATSAVDFNYGPTQVLHGVTLSVTRGEMLALVGPNGSGKTTALKLLSGDFRPRAGRVTLDGSSLYHRSSRVRAQQIAVVPQHIEPSLAFPVRTMVSMGRAPYLGALGVPRDDDRRAVDVALEEAEIVPLAERAFSTLSGGEQQRVSLAMALAQETPYLLLDEPTVHLDLHHQHRLLELLRRLQQQRRLGVLAVMHDLNLAALYFDSIVVMERGSVVAAGDVRRVLRDPDALAVFGAPLRVIEHPDDGVPQILLRRG